MDRHERARATHRPRGHARGSSATRAVLFAALSIGIVALAVFLTRPKELATVGENAADPVDLEIRIDMSGFAPSELRIPAGRAVRVRIVNPDSGMHSDGGGVHGFTVPGLGIDVRVQPSTKRILTIPAAPPGAYAFWCDTCCGGKENPTMQGRITIRG